MYKLKRTGKTWSIYLGDKLIEGGFFSKNIAQDACDRYNGEFDEDSLDLKEMDRLQASDYQD